jgi:hypothetical protein
MSTEELVGIAVQQVKSLFGPPQADPDEMPGDATLDGLWTEVKSLRRELNALKRAKRGVRPKVEDAVKLLLEDPKLAELSIPLIAEIIREVFISYKVPSSCSESSVRWYQSQRGLEWNIVRRKLPAPAKVEVSDERTDQG